MEREGPEGPPIPPAVLKPGQLGLAGARPDVIGKEETSPWSFGAMHGFTHGLN